MEVALLIVAIVIATAIFGNWSLKQAYARLATTRPSPSKNEFLSAMQRDCSPEAAEFIWEMATEYLPPILTPHPDDDLVDDLKVDPEDACIDWADEWAELHGFHKSNVPDWPEGWPATVRNFGRWLDMAPV